MNHNSIYYKRQFFLSLFLMVLYFIILLPLLFIPNKDFDRTLSIVSIFIIFNIPFTMMFIYYFIKFSYAKKINLKDIQKIKLEKTYPGFRGYSGFIVKMNIDGVIKKVETIAIYRSGFSFMGLSLDDYIGEFVTVGYDEKNNQAVILETDEYKYID